MAHRLSLLIGCAALALHGAAPAAAPTAVVPAAARPAFGSFGFDEAGMDRGVAPGDDFYLYANGTWAKTTPIPADKSNYGAFSVLDDLSTARSRMILEEAAKDRSSKIGNLYASFMDENAVESRGIDPLKRVIAGVKAIKTRDALARALGDGLIHRVDGPIAAGVAIDRKDPNQVIVSVRQAGLGLPDRDYYLNDTPAFEKVRTAYVAYLGQLLALVSEPDAQARSQAVYAFEKRIAAVQWDRVQNRQSEKTYNAWTPSDFAAKAPGFDWDGFFGAARLGGQSRYIVSQPDAIAASAKLLGEAPLPVLKDYLLLKVIDAAAPYLGRRFVDTRFAFRGTVLGGTPQIEERWKRGVTFLKEGMGEAVGRIYVARYFPPETKAAADQLVRNVIAAMDKRLAELAWMDPATRARARAKLASFRPKIGYPDRWREYSTLAVDRGDLFGNVMRVRENDWAYNLGKLGKPADRAVWTMTPMEVNAYANPTWNEIVFPAAILQSPFFDPKADPAVNYGGIGAVIGHEMSHHFDDQGRKYDEHGKLTDWWTPEDVKRFTALTDRLAAEYDAYEPLPGMHVNGRLTLGENMADLAGLTTAYDAYKLSLGGREAPVIDGFTGDQRFYLGWGQVWRRSYREANLRERLLTDPHSPNPQRAWIVRNLQPWYDAFKPAPTTKLYLAPDARVLVW